MQEEIIKNIAKTIQYLDGGAFAYVEEDQASQIKDAGLKIPPTSIRKNLLIWSGEQGLYMIESIWQEIQAVKGISSSFAREYGEAWYKLQRKNMISTLKVEKILPDAVIPSKAHPLDTGFDLTVIRVINPNFGPGVVLYGTGLRICPPAGFYVDTVARSSLCKQGWAVANAVGIIDTQYRGELCVPLFKIDPTAKDIELPARICQMIIRPLYVTDIEEVENVGQTQRGSGGFGSSGK